jgi:hypothetical protein
MPSTSKQYDEEGDGIELSIHFRAQELTSVMDKQDA